MKTRVIALLATVASFAIVSGVSGPTVLQASAAQRAAKGELRAARLNTGNGVRILPGLSSAVVETAASGQAGRSNGTAQPQAPAPNGPGGGSVGATDGSRGCSRRGTDDSGAGNVRVNQDCTYRLQGEEVIKFNPANPSNLFAGMNDERQGFNYSAFAYSFDGGRTWGDGPPPFYQKINRPEAELPTVADPNRHTITGLAGNGFTYDGGSDPIVAFDLAGRAFFGNVVFDRVLGNGAAIVVTQSPSGAGGSFFQTPTAFSRHYVIAEDNDPTVFHDKPFIAADIGPASPNRDNLYVTWTIFRLDAVTGSTTQSPIYGSMSTDHALTWSTPELISGRSETLCFFGNAFDPSLDPHSCNFDQGSDPVVLPNGDLQIIFNNGNTPANNPNAQQLGVHCHPTGSSPSGSAHLNCAAPVKVGEDVIAGEPACDFGRGPEQCIPGSYVRTNDFPRIAINEGNGNLYATWQDYRRGEYDIQLSRSTNGGLTWTPATAPVSRDRGIDHYEAAIDVVCKGQLASNNPSCVSNGGESNGSTGNSGNNDDAGRLCGDSTSGGTDRSGNSSGDDRVGVDDRVVVSYYRTCRVPNEALPAGCVYGGSPPCPVFAPPQPGVQAESSDYTLVSGLGLHTGYAGRPVSPVFPPPDGTRQTGFMGDYSGITVVGNIAHPIWSDPRNPVPPQLRDPDQPAVRDEDVFTVAVTLPGSQ